LDVLKEGAGAENDYSVWWAEKGSGLTMDDDLVIAKHVQQSGFASVIQTEEEDACLLVVQTQRPQDIPEPREHCDVKL
jgi:hypothetical protein